MRRIGFKYLKKKRLTALTLMLTAASMLFSIVALSLEGFHRGFTAYLGEEENIVAVINVKAQTHFTSLVPAYLAEKIAALKGVIASSPEMLVPCTVRGEALFLRGIVPEEFVKLNSLRLLEGEMLQLGDFNSIIAGTRVADRLGLKLGERLLVLSVLSGAHAELQVKGIFASGSAMDDEVLTPLYVGQWLRGSGYAHVTLIRVKIDKAQISLTQINSEIAEEASSSTPASEPAKPMGQQQIIPVAAVSFNLEDIGIEEAQRFMRNYLERYGVTRESLLILSAAVFLFSSASVAAASRTVISQHRRELNVLRSLGASSRLLKTDMLIKLLPCSIIASFLGVVLAMAVLAAVQEYGALQVLSHAVPIHVDPLILAVNFLLVFTLTSMTLIRAKM